MESFYIKDNTSEDPRLHYPYKPFRLHAFKYGERTVVAGLMKAVGSPFGFSKSHTHFCTQVILGQMQGICSQKVAPKYNRYPNINFNKKCRDVINDMRTDKSYLVS